jgi:superfamily II DNA or RNA helicase
LNRAELFSTFRERYGETLFGLDALTAAKGLEVFEKGRVLRVQAAGAQEVSLGGSRQESRPGGFGDARDIRLRGEVQGSAGEVYATVIDLSVMKGGRRYSSHCSCPVGQDCKHGAAMLAAWLAQESTTPMPTGARPAWALGNPMTASTARELPAAPAWAPPRPLGASHLSPGPGVKVGTALRLKSLAAWVEQAQALKVSTGARSARGSLAQAARSGFVLRYVLHAGPRAPVLQVNKHRVLRNGALSNPEPYSALIERAPEGAAFWTDTDRSVAAFLASELRSSTASFRQGYPLTSRLGPQILSLLAQSGALFLRAPLSLDSNALQLGASRHANLAWRAPDEEASREAPVEGPSPQRYQLGIESDAGVVVLYLREPWYLDAENLQIGPLDLGLRATESLMRWLETAPIVQADEVAAVSAQIQDLRLRDAATRAWLPVPDGFEVQERDGVAVPALRLRQVPWLDALLGSGATRSEMAHAIVAEVSMIYEGRPTAPLGEATVLIEGSNERSTDIDESTSTPGSVLLRRDLSAERQWVSQLSDELRRAAGSDAVHPAASSDQAESAWQPLVKIAAGSVGAARWVYESLNLLREEGWQVEDCSGLAINDLADAPIDLALANEDMSASGDWFHLQMGIQVGGERLDLAPVIEQLLSEGAVAADSQGRLRLQQAQRFLWVRSASGQVHRVAAQRLESVLGVLGAWVAREGDLANSSASRSGLPAPLRMNRFAAAQLLAQAQSQEGLEVKAHAPLARLADVFRNFSGLPELNEPEGFEARLRPYQRDGLRWLQFLSEAQLGGVLADDMGLGKTVQVLAHLSTEQTKAGGRLSPPALVVTPTSLTFNWLSEAQRHAPRLKVLDLTGAGRSLRFDAIDDADLVLTSYALLVRDQERLLPRDWSVVVLDEAHAIKNARTQLAVIAQQLKARQRLALTGTPLENHLGELWSILQFAQPGLLGEERFFNGRFRTPIEKRGGTDQARQRLSALEKRLKPFLLRRSKDAVEADLPPKTEVVERIVMATAQRDLYESIRVVMDKRVRDALTQAGLARSHIVVLDALLKLRQVCCDPRLAPATTRQAHKQATSSKLEALLELLDTLVAEGRRVLVFSQFTSMLDLIEQALEEHDSLAAQAYVRLDGSTRDRASVVNRFQSGAVPFMLLSLKAGGVGLNLTAADTVIHYDPWWNPAVEQQATDRTHRIGQDKPVFVYKLIAADTVEERIVELQTRKADLAAAVLTEDPKRLATALTQDDLLALLAPPGP